MYISKDVFNDFNKWCEECTNILNLDRISLLKHSNNQIPFNKRGAKIKIKKENRGKFTDYCGGKVTSACISKGKNSPNPTIRKRATFAANARKWKHKKGGTIRYTEEGKIVPDKCPKCGEDIIVLLRGEPIYTCKNNHYFGTVKFKK